MSADIDDKEGFRMRREIDITLFAGHSPPHGAVAKTLAIGILTSLFAASAPKPNVVVRKLLERRNISIETIFKR